MQICSFPPIKRVELPGGAMLRSRYAQPIIDALGHYRLVNPVGGIESIRHWRITGSNLRIVNRCLGIGLESITADV